MNCVQVVLLIFVFIKSTIQETIDGTGNQQVEDVSLSPSEESALKSISLGTRQFATKLYSFISNKEGNVILSPLSLQVMLALVFAGSRGATSGELAKLLSLEDNNERRALIGHKGLIKAVQNQALNLANRMFVDQSFPVKKDFQANAIEYFFSRAKSLDFKNEPDNSRQHINSWVQRQTNYKIRDVLEENQISATTRLVLVNAIYFKANWKTRFDESDTKEQPFFLSRTEKVKVPMMSIESTFDILHDQDLRAQFLRLDYEGGKFEMIVILPEVSDGISDLESKLENIDLYNRLSKVESKMVKVKLPKFKVEKTYELTDVLRSMGAPSMFSKSADLGGISDKQLSISSVVQKAFIEVNENGTEAAAATAVLGEFRSLFSGPVPFTADHPFVFIIGLKERQIPIFCGRYAGPDK